MVSTMQNSEYSVYQSYGLIYRQNIHSM